MKLITQRLSCQGPSDGTGPFRRGKQMDGVGPSWRLRDRGVWMRRSAREFEYQHRRDRACGYRHVVGLFTKSEQRKGSGRVNKKTAKRVAGGMPPLLSKFPPTFPFSVGPGGGGSVESNASNRPEQRGPGRAVGQGHQWLGRLMMIGGGGWMGRGREKEELRWAKGGAGHGGRVRTVKTGISRSFGRGGAGTVYSVYA